MSRFDQDDSKVHVLKEKIISSQVSGHTADIHVNGFRRLLGEVTGIHILDRREQPLKTPGIDTDNEFSEKIKGLGVIGPRGRKFIRCGTEHFPQGR